MVKCTIEEDSLVSNPRCATTSYLTLDKLLNSTVLQGPHL